MRKPRVSYQMVERGLGTDPRAYVKELRRETGLSYDKIAHDLAVDAGVGVHRQTVRNWGNSE